MNTQQKPLIYLVDDKPEIGKVVALYLRESMRSEYFSDGYELLRDLRNESTELPAVIVSDVNMPCIDGYGVLEELRADEKLKSIPVIILSSVESSADRVALLEMGAADFLLKPFNPKELKLRIEKLLQ